MEQNVQNVIPLKITFELFLKTSPLPSESHQSKVLDLNIFSVQYYIL